MRCAVLLVEDAGRISAEVFNVFVKVLLIDLAVTVDVTVFDVDGAFVDVTVKLTGDYVEVED